MISQRLASRTSPPDSGAVASPPGRVCEIRGLMEYVFLLIVIAVWRSSPAAGCCSCGRAAGGLRPAGRRPRRRPAAFRGGEQAAEDRAGEAEATAAVIEVERPPPSAGRMVRLRARLARSQ